MVVRTYFNRNNTLVFNSIINTGRNPITELYYGGGDLTNKSYSRFIFQFDETRLKNLYEDKTFADLSKLKHTLRMTNTGAFDVELLGNDTCSGKKRASSFDLILFKIEQEWDEGVGYDYVGISNQTDSIVLSTSPSNWFAAKTNSLWDNSPGIYSGSSSIQILGTQHFEQGNENIEIDVTDVVNGYLTGDTNYGLGIAFPYAYENLTTDQHQYVGFFTRHTQTFYEPFIETTYSCKIKDDRNDFYLDKPNRLYLYVNLGGKPTNLDQIPTVKIFDNCSNEILNYTQDDVVNCTKGVYYIDILIPTSGDTYPGVLFNDVWGDIIINGIERPDIELSFEIKDSMDYYNIGDNDSLPKKVGFNISGINHNEKIKRGDIRKVSISTRIPYTVEQIEKVDRLQYRLYVKEGKNEYTVIDYQDVEMTANSNYFLLDTASLIPNTYYLDVKYESNLEVSSNREILKFDIVSQVELRISQ
jgi:hypothetical protein